MRGLNSGIVSAAVGLSEVAAKDLLRSLKCSFRVTHRDGYKVKHLSDDRDDCRYNLMVEGGIVARIYGG